MRWTQERVTGYWLLSLFPVLQQVNSSRPWPSPGPLVGALLLQPKNQPNFSNRMKQRSKDITKKPQGTLGFGFRKWRTFKSDALSHFRSQITQTATSDPPTPTPCILYLRSVTTEKSHSKQQEVSVDPDMGPRVTVSLEYSESFYQGRRRQNDSSRLSSVSK